MTDTVPTVKKPDRDMPTPARPRDDCRRGSDEVWRNISISWFFGVR
jgi:hypothetical protein